MPAVTVPRPPGRAPGLTLLALAVAGFACAETFGLGGVLERPARAAPPVTSAAAPAPASTQGASLGVPAAPAATAGSPAPVGGVPSPVPPTAETTTLAPSSGGEGAAVAGGASIDPPPVPRVVLTGDVAQAESDHERTVGAWGIEVRPVATTLPVFARRASTGCPLAPLSTDGAMATPGSTAPTPDCPPVVVSMLGLRHWVNRNLAWTVGAALALGGGTQNGRLLDSYFGFGPGAGVSVLLGNWKHLAVAASPSLAFVWFRAAGSVATTYVADLRADLEGELHFGFIGVPALSLSMRSGILVRLEKAADLTLWSAGVSGATSLRGLVSDLSLRYYF